MGMIDNELIKALRCLASQDEEGDCYREHHNFMHVDGDEPEIYCGSEPQDGRTQCPYYQNRYGVCFEDGQCSKWLEAAADGLELYASLENILHDAEMAADIDQAVEYFKDERSQMNVFSELVFLPEGREKEHRDSA